MTRRIWQHPLRHVSKRDPPTPRGHIRGVSFLDTPESGKGRSPFVTVKREEWEDAQRAANAGRWGLAIAGLVVALAIIWVANS